MSFLRFAKKIKRDLWPYQPTVEILISRQSLLHNLHQFQSRYPKLTFAPVLKSNAYGHGLSLVASILDKEKITFFVVDSLFEAKVLRNDGIQSPILVLGFVTPENIMSNTDYRVAFTVTSLEQLAALSGLKRKTDIHLKIDTGMNRQGILPQQVDKAIKLIKAVKNLSIVGICSHFADADSGETTFTKQQIQVWQTVHSQLRQAFPTITYSHLAATAGVDFSQDFESNVARLGAGLYGLNRSPSQPLDLKLTLEMRLIIGSVKEIPTGASVGYNMTHTTRKPMKIATVPVGYYEGVDRRLSNQGFFRVNGIHCPIVGRVSMNITTIDVTAVPNVKMGDAVTVISPNYEDKNSVEQIALAVDTVAHEILIHLPQSLRRTII